MSQLLGGDDRIRLPPGLAARFIESLARAAQVNVEVESMRIAGGSQAQILELLRAVYEPTVARDEADASA